MIRELDRACTLALFETGLSKTPRKVTTWYTNFESNDYFWVTSANHKWLFQGFGQTTRKPSENWMLFSPDPGPRPDPGPDPGPYRVQDQIPHRVHIVGWDYDGELSAALAALPLCSQHRLSLSFSWRALGSIPHPTTRQTTWEANFKPSNHFWMTIVKNTKFVQRIGQNN